MKLKKIVVSGFKSFVDQTEVRFNSQFVGVVGPNGCGKSNVIDAVRWVMGESSAKMLRGESMDDVIFNGSSVRKPVGRASVELVFDNSLGRIKSQYKQFAEIAVKRVLNRNGQSEYRINDRRVRRKDVLDLFRGTGLGPRSYSIIEQGMVSRIVEAKPEDLRNYVEEAAGISRYKDRRRETENRIRQTRENIERSVDIRSELLAQLRRLKRQAQAAARYKKLRKKKRERTTLLYRLRLADYDGQVQQQVQLLDKQTNQLEKKLSKQRKVEARIEAQRLDQGKAQDKLNDIQGSFYQVGAQISKLEQKIEHIKLSKQQDSLAISEANTALGELNMQLEADIELLAQYNEQKKLLAPSIEADNESIKQARLTYELAQENHNSWQQQFALHREQQQSQLSQQQLQNSIIDQINRQQKRAQERKNQLKEEGDRLESQLGVDELELLVEDLTGKQGNFDQLNTQVEQSYKEVQWAGEQAVELNNQLNTKRELLSSITARIASLQEFQSAALNDQHKEYQQWIESEGLKDARKLAGGIKIEKGWERAADRILAPYLNAFIDPSGKHQFWRNIAEQSVTLISTDTQRQAKHQFPLSSLSSFIEATFIDIDALVKGIYVALDSSEALQYRNELQNGERIVTRDGVLYGRNWVSHVGTATSNTGYLVREEEIQNLTSREKDLTGKIALLLKQEDEVQQKKKGTLEENTALQLRQEELRQKITQGQRDIAQKSTAKEYTQERLGAVEQEVADINQHSKDETLRLKAAHNLLVQTDKGIEDMQLERSKLENLEIVVKQDTDKALADLRMQQSEVQARKLELTRLETQAASLENNRVRTEQQLTQLEQRKESLLKSDSSNAEPLEQLNQSLETNLKRHKEVEARLLAKRDEITSKDNALRKLQSDLSSCIEQVNQYRTVQETARLALQDSQIRQQTLGQQAESEGFDIHTDTIALLDISLEDCEHEINQIDRKITSIGAVNLVAIDEYESQSERANYLEMQHNDLQKALETLEKAIAKIDKETRTRFEQTYTALNRCFTDYFPKLFGGGKASLQLTSEDWLTAGIMVMAQPPGKRNSTIHLLSGGEKALTAVALLFALFELNPAPFCMMDEVDAPLDDANVDRFCDTLRSLSEYAQIIVITHNKITMQVANGLIGVTMHEPGVSRVVSVDIEKAIEMAEI